MNIPIPKHDKLLHHFWGGHVTTVGLLIGLALRACLGWPVDPRAVGLLACAAVALGREAWNVTHGGRWSWADITWTLAGALYPVGGYSAGGAA